MKYPRINAQVEQRTGDGILEEFRVEFLECWHRLPNKGFFLVLLAVWLALFQFIGNATRGYVKTASLYYWMYDAFGARNGNLWESDGAAAVLMPFVVLWLFWAKRRQLLALDLGLWAPGLVLVLLGLMMHFLGFWVQLTYISVVGLFVGLYGLTGLTWGLSWLRASFFPFFLFIFCLPLGTLTIPITFRLSLMASWLCQHLCHYVVALDVIRQGTTLSDPAIPFRFDVAAACSGIRSLYATMALSLIFGFIFFRTWWRRLLMILAAFPLAVMGNVLRLMTIVLAAEIGGSQAAGEKVHEGGPLGIYSLLPYVPAFVGLFLMERYLREKPQRPARTVKAGHRQIAEGEKESKTHVAAEVTRL
ncbi:MAG: exosortase [Verrucomicrobia bacterium]|nr:MAG: exosortase [Verrucomicrobiota bacterium]